MDSCFDLEYLNMVIMEGLRFQPPGGLSPIKFDQDVTLADKLKVKKGDCILVLHWALHKNRNEW